MREELIAANKEYDRLARDPELLKAQGEEVSVTERIKSGIDSGVLSIRYPSEHQEVKAANAKALEVRQRLDLQIQRVSDVKKKKTSELMALEVEVEFLEKLRAELSSFPIAAPLPAASVDVASIVPTAATARAVSAASEGPQDMRRAPFVKESDGAGITLPRMDAGSTMPPRHSTPPIESSASTTAEMSVASGVSRVAPAAPLPKPPALPPATADATTTRQDESPTAINLEFTKGDKESFGIRIEALQDGRTFINKVSKDRLGERIKLQVGDIIVSINGRELKGLKHEDVVELIN